MSHLRAGLIICCLCLCLRIVAVVASYDMKIDYTSSNPLTLTESDAPSFSDCVFGMSLDTPIPQSSSETVTVSIRLDNSNGFETPCQTNLSNAGVTFNKDNWNQTVHVGIKSKKIDKVSYGNFGFKVLFNMYGSNWNKVPSIVVVNVDFIDNDVAGVVLSRTNILAVEGQAAETVTVQLATEPLGTVTVALPNSDPHVQFTPSTLTFSPLNYGTQQTVAVGAKQDADPNEERSHLYTYPLALSSTSTADAAAYQSSSSYAFSIDVRDDDKLLQIGTICAQGNVDADPRPRSGDLLIINFTEPTNGNSGTVLSKAQVDSMFAFSSPLGNDYNGRWSTDGAQLKITIIDAKGQVDNNTVVDTLAVTCKNSSVSPLKDKYSVVVPVSTGPSATHVVRCGTWGGVRTFQYVLVARNTGNQDGFGPMDAIDVYFNTSTNGMGLNASARTLFTFVPSLGAMPVALSWHSAAHARIVFGNLSAWDDAKRRQSGIGRFSVQLKEPVKDNPLKAVDTGSNEYPFYANYGADIIVREENTIEEYSIESVASPSHASPFLLLTLRRPVRNKETVRVMYQSTTVSGSLFDHNKLVGLNGGTKAFNAIVDNYVGTPQVVNCTVDSPKNVSILLDYPLLSTSSPSTGPWTVSVKSLVNDFSPAVESVAFLSNGGTTKNTIRLVLVSPIRHGETVRVLFKPGQHQASYNSLHGSLFQFETYAWNNVSPSSIAPASAYVHDDTALRDSVTLEFNDPIANLNAVDPSQFVVNVINANREESPTSMTLQAYKVILKMPTEFAYRETFKVSYTHNVTAIEGVAGGVNYVASFTDFSGSNAIRAPVPEPTKANINSEDKVFIEFSTPITSGTTRNGDWSVSSVKHGSATLQSPASHTVTKVTVDSTRTIRLDIDGTTPLRSGYNVTVEYKRPVDTTHHLFNTYAKPLDSFRWANTVNELITKLLYATIETAAPKNISLVFDSWITSSTMPDSGFAVTVDGANNNVVGHFINSQSGVVLVCLQNPVKSASNATRVSFTQSSSSAAYITNAVGGQAASFAPQMVYNTIGTPEVKSVSVESTNAGVARILFNLEVAVASSLSAHDFSVYVNGNMTDKVKLTKAEVVIDKIELTLETPLDFGDTFWVLYTKNTTNSNQNLKSKLTNVPLESFPAPLLGTNRRGTTCCTTSTLDVASVAGAHGRVVILGFQHSLDKYNGVTKDGYSISVNGVDKAVESIQLQQGKVALTMSAADQVVDMAAVVRVSYSHTNNDNPPVVTFANHVITLQNSTTTVSVSAQVTPSPALVGLAWTQKQGDRIVATFDRNLNETEVPLTSKFEIEVDSAAQSPRSLAISGSTLTAVLDSSIDLANAISVILTYTKTNQSATMVQVLTPAANASNSSTNSSNQTNTQTVIVSPSASSVRLQGTNGANVHSFSKTVTRHSSPRFVSAVVSRLNPRVVNITLSHNLITVGDSVIFRRMKTVSRGTFGNYDGPPSIVKAIAYDSTSNPSPGISDYDVLDLHFSVPTNKPSVAYHSDIETLLTFSSLLGTNLTGYWKTASVLSITICCGIDNGRDVVDLYKTQVNRGGSTKGLQVSVNEKGGLITVDGSNGAVACIDSAYLNEGTWGNRSAPLLVTATAENTGNGPGINNGDSIVLCFDAETNYPIPDGSHEVLSWFTFHASSTPATTTILGSQFDLVWINATCARLTIVDTSGLDADPATTRSCTKASAFGATGCLHVSMVPGNRIRHLDNSSSYAGGQFLKLKGSWGTHPASSSGSADAVKLVSICGESGGSAGALDSGDRLVIVFSSPPYQLDLSSKAKVDSLFGFSASIGANYSAEWRNLTSLVITVINASSAADRMLTTYNILTLTLKTSGNMLPADLEGIATTGSAKLSCGTFGIATPPVILSLVASGTAGGISNNDKLTISFDQQVLTPSIATKEDVDALFQFSAGIGKNYSGKWLSHTVAEITMLDVTNGFIYTGTWFLIPLSGSLYWHNTSEGSSRGCQCAVSPSPSRCICTSEPQTSDMTNGTAFTVLLPSSPNVPLELQVETVSSTYITYKVPNDPNFQTPLPNVFVEANISHTSNPFPPPLQSPSSETAVGALVVQVKSDTFQLLSRDSMSSPSTAAAVLTGSWGSNSGRALPEIHTVVAVNNGGESGLNNGDEVKIKFSADVRRQSSDAVVSLGFTSSAIMEGGQWQLMFKKNGCSFGTGVVGGNGTSSTALQMIVNALVPFAPSGVVVSKTPTSFALTFGECPWCDFDSVTLSVLNATGQASGSVVVSTDVPPFTLESSDFVDTLIAFSSPIGMSYSGYWNSPRQLTIKIDSAISGVAFKDTRIGALNFKLLANAIESADRSQVQGTETQWVSVAGSWGSHAPPQMTQAVASDPADPPEKGFTTKDVLEVFFDKETNMPSVSTKGGVDDLLDWTSIIEGTTYNCKSVNCFAPGSDYEGKWVTPKLLKISVTDATLTKSPHYQSTGNDGIEISPEKQLEIGNFHVVLKNSGRLKSLDLSSGSASGVIKVSGDWGTPIMNQNVVQIFYMIALFGSALAFTYFILKSIYIYTCRPKVE